MGICFLLIRPTGRPKTDESFEPRIRFGQSWKMAIGRAINLNIYDSLVWDEQLTES